MIVKDLNLDETRDFLGLNKPRFYKLKADGVIPNGVKKTIGSYTRDTWNKEELKKVRRKIYGNPPKPPETIAQSAASNAFNMCLK
jgi:hypothetical protein